ncbi:rubredoxin-like domain-containing protein [Phosphitispora sp. TUW77]
MAKWRCRVCGHIVESDKAPSGCSKCMLGALVFERMEDTDVKA